MQAGMICGGWDPYEGEYNLPQPYIHTYFHTCIHTYVRTYILKQK